MLILRAEQIITTETQLVWFLILAQSIFTSSWKFLKEKYKENENFVSSKAMIELTNIET